MIMMMGIPLGLLTTIKTIKIMIMMTMMIIIQLLLIVIFTVQVFQISNGADARAILALWLRRTVQTSCD